MADNIATVTATLSGVASQLNIDNSATSAPANVAMTFAKQPNASYKVTVRLLGIVQSADQQLTTTIAFIGRSPMNMTQTSDHTTKLAAFNGDKKTPMTLGAQSVETPTEVDSTYTITDWIGIGEEIGTAE